MITINTEFLILLIIFCVFMLLSVLGTWFNLEKYGFFFFPLGFIYKTEFFNKILIKIADRGKRLHEVIYRIGKILALVITGVLIIYFIVNPFLLMFRSPFGIGLRLIIPGVTIDLKTALLFIIPIIFTLIPHEMAHAIMARKEGIKIKSSGIFILLILFGGFVELAKDSLEKALPKKRIKVYMNGASINAVFAVIFLGLYFLTPAISLIGFKQADGVLVTNVYEGYPADKVGIQKKDVIIGMGKYNESLQKIVYIPVNNVKDYNSVILQFDNNSSLYVQLLQNETIVVTPTITDPISGQNVSDKVYLGINIFDYYSPRVKWLSPMIPYYWNIEALYTLNLCVMAVFVNMLPLGITDGDKIFREYMNLKSKNESKKRKILYGVRIFSALIIILNIVFTMIRW